MTLTAGTATADISPLEATALFGYPHVKRISTGIHDPLLASVLVLDNGSGRVVLAALDLLFVEPPFARELRQAVATAAATKEELVFISCTHTHSGPVTTQLLGWRHDHTIPPPSKAYLLRVKQQLLHAVSEAVHWLHPAELAVTVAAAGGVGGNRRAEDGVTDPDCGVIAVRRQGSHQILALSLTYGMHPTVMHEDSTLVSSDFPYFTRSKIQQHLGEAIPILYHTAPCGNQSPRRFVSAQTFGEAERLGHQLGAAVNAVLDRLTDRDWQTQVRLAGRLTPVELPRRDFPSVAAAKEILQECHKHYKQLLGHNAPKAEVRTAECSIFGAESVVALAEAAAQGKIHELVARYAPIEVQVLRLGTVVLVGLPGESFTEYALAIKQQARVKTFVVSLVNGELQGYIVTPEAAAEGGYEAHNAIFAPAAGEVLVRAAVASLREMIKE